MSRAYRNLLCRSIYFSVTGFQVRNCLREYIFPVTDTGRYLWRSQWRQCQLMGILCWIPYCMVQQFVQFKIFSYTLTWLARLVFKPMPSFSHQFAGTDSLDWKGYSVFTVNATVGRFRLITLFRLFWLWLALAVKSVFSAPRFGISTDEFSLVVGCDRYYW